MIEYEIRGLDELMRKTKELPASVSQAMRGFFTKSSIKVEEKAKKRFVGKGESWGGGRPHVRTGRLRSSITHKVDPSPTPLWAIIGTNVEYAPIVELGARPHEIKPVRRKALRFEVAGKEIFAKVVHHPGSPPHPFLGAGLEESKGDIDRYLEEAGSQIEKEWNK